MGRNKILDNVLLDNIAMAMNDGSYEMQWYLDIEEAAVVLISDYGDEDTEALEELIEADEKGERFKYIPKKTGRDGWNLMDEFIRSLDDIDETTRRSLFRSIEGRGAFRRFKDIVYEFGIQDRWFEYSGRKERKEVLEWLCSLNLISESDMDEGVRLYDEMIAKRKQREQDQLNMKTGARVLCIDNHGHADKLSPGKVYEVLDERPDDLLIRLKDDRGKICWLPKSHFELL
jgi:hypothetical protein